MEVAVEGDEVGVVENGWEGDVEVARGDENVNGVGALEGVPNENGDDLGV